MIASKGRRSHGQSERKKYRQDHTEAKLKLGNRQPGSKPEVD